MSGKGFVAGQNICKLTSAVHPVNSMLLLHILFYCNNSCRLYPLCWPTSEWFTGKSTVCCRLLQCVEQAGNVTSRWICYMLQPHSLYSGEPTPCMRRRHVLTTLCTSPQLSLEHLNCGWLNQHSSSSQHGGVHPSRCPSRWGRWQSYSVWLENE